MTSGLIQLLVLAGIVIFLVLRLKSVLGTREGFERSENAAPQSGAGEAAERSRRDFEVIEGGPDRDISDHVEEGSDTARALAAMKMAEPAFVVGDFLQGARGAYEMILMAFEKGDLDSIQPYLAEDVFQSFVDALELREREGLQVEAEFVGVRELVITEAHFDGDTSEGEITVRFLGEMTSVVRNAEGEVVEGDPNKVQRQRDVWSFARVMGGEDPNWKLSATDE